MARCLPLMLAGLLLLSPSLSSQEPVQRKYPVFDVVPLFGYRSGMTVPIDSGVAGANPRISTPASSSYGLSVGLHLRTGDTIAFTWIRQDSFAQVQGSIPASSKQSAALDRFHCDLVREYLVPKWGRVARPFVTGSVGVSHLFTDTSSGIMQFSIGVGGGINMAIHKHLGFRVQAQWFPTFVQPQAASFCGGGCTLHVSGSLTSQAEITFGPVLRF